MSQQASTPPSLRVLGPVVPEKHGHHSDVLAGLASQCHTQLAQGAASLDGTVQRAPALPAPLPLTSPSGLSRTQFLIASHAATVPAIPSTSGQDGGLVLDRVLLQGGSPEHHAFWAALTGRAKLQRILSRRRQHGWKRALGDPEGYTLGLNMRLRARPGTNLKIAAELQPRSTTDGCDGQQGGSSQQMGGGQQQQQVGGFKDALRESTVRASSQLQHRLRHAELRGSLSCNQKLQHCKGYATVPLSSSIDLCTPQQQTTPLQFRAGIYHATAPSGLTDGDSSQPLRTSVHMLGGLALQGERGLWSGNPAARRVKLYKQQQQRQQQQGSRSSSATSGPAGARNAGSQPSSSRASPSQPHTASSASRDTAQGSTQGMEWEQKQQGGSRDARPRSNATLGPHNPIRQYLQRLLPHGHHAGSGVSENEDEGNGWAPRSRGYSSSSRGQEWLVPDADQVQESVIDAMQSTSRLREDVQSLTDWVSSGAFSEQLQQRIGSGKGKSRAPPPPPTTTANQPPWSSLLGPPHFRIAGMFGTSLSAPLCTAQHSSKSDSERGSLHGTPSFESLRSSLSSARQEVAVRPFASAAASLQLGWFQRPAFDYTRVVGKLDLAVPGSAQQAGSPSIHPAFGLEGRGAWHALTLSLRQQLMGPLRFCADVRYSLESKHPWKAPPPLPAPLPPSPTGPLPHPGQQSTMVGKARGNHASERAQNFARHVSGMRPSLLESAYGLDLVIPGTAGFGRLVAWYAPGRKEGMVELRLF